MRILLAEDEEALSKALVTILKHENYLVDAAFDGEQALDFLSAGEYDAVILDVMMPKKDGIEVLKTLRANKNSVPVLMLTAKSEICDRVEGLDSGADDYLTKPFNVDELLARIRVITRRQGSPVSDELVFGDLKLIKKTGKLRSAKGETALTAKEYRLIELFMTAPGEIFSQERIIDKIWGWDSDADPGVVWTYVSYLRKKLKAIGSDAEIKAVRNLGYRLEKCQ